MCCRLQQQKRTLQASSLMDTGKHLIPPTLLIFTCWQRLPTCELIQCDDQHEHVGFGQLRVVTFQNFCRNVPAGWQTSEMHRQQAPLGTLC